MTLLLPFLLAGPVLVLATAVVALAAHGPLGWLAGALLVGTVLWVLRWSWRMSVRWWRSTKAPVRAPVPARPRPH